MSTETPPLDPRKVKSIADAMEMKSKNRIRKLSSALWGGTCFMWYVWLGTAVYLEEKVVQFSKTSARKGQAFEAKTKTELGERARRARQAALRLSRSRVNRAGSLFGDKLHRPLHLLGMPSQRDMDRLQRMAEEMSVAVTELSQQTQSSTNKKQTSSTKGNGASKARS